jgi:methylamine---glutamate N-methyltransferase subunit A
MCGIAGLIYRDGDGDGDGEIGRDMTRMLQSMKHRGPDSTGYALYGPRSDAFVMRVKLAEGNEPRTGERENRLRRHRSELEDRMRSVGAKVTKVDQNTDYALTVTFEHDGDLRDVADRVEAIKSAEVLSLGHSLEIIKDLGDAESVASQYKLGGFQGTHAIGHVRMATESDVDIASAHPYWAYPFPDVAVVHNGQLTNYHQWRRRLERSGHRFQSDCDSEVIAVYLAEQLAGGMELEDAIRQSVEDFDGVFTYICVTEDALGAAKDELAAKPLVLYESDELVALASEEIAIREVLEEEIETHDPYEGEVMVWKR